MGQPPAQLRPPGGRESIFSILIFLMSLSPSPGPGTTELTQRGGPDAQKVLVPKDPTRSGADGGQGEQEDAPCRAAAVQGAYTQGKFCFGSLSAPLKMSCAAPAGRCHPENLTSKANLEDYGSGAARGTSSAW